MTYLQELETIITMAQIEPLEHFKEIPPYIVLSDMNLPICKFLIGNTKYKLEKELEGLTKEQQNKLIFLTICEGFRDSLSITNKRLRDGNKD